MRNYSARSLSNLRGIHPDLRRVINRALQESPLDFVVIEGLRTVDRQKQLVAQGASKTMNSRHITGHAVDLLPIGLDGKAAFDWPLYNRLGPAVEAAAAKEGVKIVWGGRWSKFRDGPHFELDRKVYPATAWTTGQTAPATRSDPLGDDDAPMSSPAVVHQAGKPAPVAPGLPYSDAKPGWLAWLLWLLRGKS
jgi:peptidoglycan LD-endopeptidase CwlK